MPIPTDAAVVQTTGFNTGLFGYDLTGFFAYCLTADDCDSDSINDAYFDGWAIGANITLDTYLADSSQYDLLELSLIVAFEYSLVSFGFATDDTDGIISLFYT